MRPKVLLLMVVLVMLVACTTSGEEQSETAVATKTTRAGEAEVQRPTATIGEEAYVSPVVPSEAAQPVAEVQRATPTLPPTPTPPPLPTPYPLMLAENEITEAATAEWKVFEDREMGIRFRYPPEYDGLQVQKSEGEIYLNIYESTGEMAFASLFITRNREASRYMERAEDVAMWIEGSPFAPDGRVRVVGAVEPSMLGGKWTYAWYIQWEPIYGWSFGPIYALLLVKDDFVVWVNIGDLSSADVVVDEDLWPQQMAFLKTVEPVE